MGKEASAARRLADVKRLRCMVAEGVLDLTPEIREDHASYIASWLKVLKNDKRAIFTAASHAQRAADYLKSLQPGAQAEAA